MKKEIRVKLALNKETVANFTGTQMEKVKAGFMAMEKEFDTVPSEIAFHCTTNYQENCAV